MHNSIFATIAVKLFISAALSVVLPLSMVSIVQHLSHIPIIASPTNGYWTYVTPLFLTFGFILTLCFDVLVARV